MTVIAITNVNTTKKNLVNLKIYFLNNSTCGGSWCGGVSLWLCLNLLIRISCKNDVYVGATGLEQGFGLFHCKTPQWFTIHIDDFITQTESTIPICEKEKLQMKLIPKWFAIHIDHFITQTESILPICEKEFFCQRNYFRSPSVSRLLIILYGEVRDLAVFSRLVSKCVQVVLLGPNESKYLAFLRYLSMNSLTIIFNCKTPKLMISSPKRNQPSLFAKMKNCNQNYCCDDKWRKGYEIIHF